MFSKMSITNIKENISNALSSSVLSDISMTSPSVPENSNHLRTPPTFNLKSISVALEAIEDEAFVDEINFAQERKRKDRQKEKECYHLKSQSRALDDIVKNPKTTTQNRTSNSLDASFNAKSPLNEDITSVISSFDEILEKRKMNVANDRMKKREAFLLNSKKQAEEALKKLNKEKQKKIRKQYLDLLKFNQLSKESAERIKLEAHEHDRRKAKLLKTKLQEAEERQRIQVLMEEKRIKEGKERLESAQNISSEIQIKHKNISNIINTFKYQNALESEGQLALFNNISNFTTQCDYLLKNCMSRGLMSEDDYSKIFKLNDVVSTQVEEIKTNLALVLVKYENLEKEEQQKQLNLKKQAEDKERKAAEKARINELKKNNPEYNAPKLPKELRLCICKSAYETYSRLQEKFKKYDESSKTFCQQSATKRLMFSLRKAVSVLIVNITGRSGSEVSDTIRKLVDILKGRIVKVGTESVSTQNKEDATIYVLDLITKKIMQQAKAQISANFDAAFGIALVVLGIWSQSDEFGELFLAHLYKACPFTVPYYIPKLDRTPIEYSRVLGYIVDEDGIVEKQDVYLKRMSGLVRLYAAVLQSPLPPGISKHPHGLCEGWKWFSRMLHLEPRPEVTATVLFDFLDVAGHAMMRSYGKQFEKILYAICHDYYTKIEEISESKAAVSRLKAFLEKCIKERTVREPKGHLDASFWRTYHAQELIGN